jgi:hypothetical protein
LISGDAHEDEPGNNPPMVYKGNVGCGRRKKTGTDSYIESWCIILHTTEEFKTSQLPFTRRRHEDSVDTDLSMC